MSTFLTIIGGIAFVLLGLCMLAGLVAIAAECCGRAMEKFKYSVENETRMNIGNRMLGDSWWFSEDVRVCRALSLYAKMLHTGVGDVSSVREEWRKIKDTEWK